MTLPTHNEPTATLSVSEIRRLMGKPEGLFYEGCRCPVCSVLRRKLEPLGLLPKGMTLNEAARNMEIDLG